MQLQATRTTITEPAREIPVLMNVDIVVVGGGTTGPFAAISAARRGKKVVMIERFGSLGGNLTLGLNTKPSGAIVGGLPLEVWNLARSVGGAGEDYMAMTKTGGVKIAFEPPDISASLVLVGKDLTSPVGTCSPAVPDSSARSMMPWPGRMKPPRKRPPASTASTVTAVPTITTTIGRAGPSASMRWRAPIMATQRSAPRRVGWS